jgi:uncharacterized protein (DUF1684 family)
MTRMKSLWRVLAVPAVVLATAATAAGQGGYDVDSLNKFREGRVKALLADDGWFTVAGLHFLSPGENTFGSDPLNDIVLDFPEVPKQAGVVTMTGRDVSIRAAEGQTLTYNGQPSREGVLRLSEGDRRADLITYGGVSFFLHYSGPRLGLRVRNTQAPLRVNFKGLNWYAPDPAFRVVGTFTPLTETKVVQAPNILGDLEPFTVAGHVTFALGGKTHTMEAWKSGDQLWFVFRDLTSSDTTYPSARFLYTPMARDGQAVMDFNYARNPPCAYNPWTTCPLPPAMNRLSVRVDAGEKRYFTEGTSSAAVLRK